MRRSSLALCFLGLLANASCAFFRPYQRNCEQNFQWDKNTPAEVKARFAGWMTKSCGELVRQTWIAHDEVFYKLHRTEPPPHVLQLEVIEGLSGKITALKVTESSGIPELDQAVQDGILHSMDPLDPPPKEVLDPSGQFTWRMNFVPDTRR